MARVHGKYPLKVQGHGAMWFPDNRRRFGVQFRTSVSLGGVSMSLIESTKTFENLVVVVDWLPNNTGASPRIGQYWLALLPETAKPSVN